jgi:hypothetical protein
MRSIRSPWLVASVVLCACGAADPVIVNDAADASSAPRPPRDGALADAGVSVPGITGPDGGAAQDAKSDPPPESGLAADLLALTAKCDVASNGKYATDVGEKATVDICKLKGAFFWKADLDVDCDGQQTTECNKANDPDYQNQTSFTQQSDGKPLIASKLPYVVIPLPSSRFRYDDQGIEPGALIIVIYQGKVAYGVFGDQGPDQIIGEASYAMAKSLGIDANPASGGTDSGVTYIALTGKGAVVRPIEDHAAAVKLGEKLAAALVTAN